MLDYSWPKIVQTTQGHGLSGSGLRRDHCTAVTVAPEFILHCACLQSGVTSRSPGLFARLLGITCCCVFFILCPCDGCPPSAAPADSNCTPGAMSSAVFEKIPVDYRSRNCCLHRSYLKPRTGSGARRADGWCAGALLAAGTVPGPVARRIAVTIT
jgi:hypothetical protein